METKIYKLFLQYCRLGLLLSILYLPSVLLAQDPNFHIYLLFGQSNMEGMGAIEAQDRVANNRVKVLQDQTCSNLGRTYGQWYTAAPPLNRCWSGLGPGDWFGKTMADAMPSHITIGLVATAVGGCDIAFFQKGAPLGKAATNGGGNADIPSQFTGGYAWMLDMATKAKQVGVIKGILFHQGETNTGDAAWKTKVQGIVSDLKKDLGIGDVPFLAGELLYQQYNSCCARHNTEINKLPSLIPNSYVISASNLPGMDEAHFSSASYRELGKRYAQKMISLVNNNCTSTTIMPSVKIADGAWQTITEVNVDPQVKIMLGPQPVTEGTWTWNGCGTIGTTREQSFTATSSCTATASYTNECGATSTLSFKINVKGVQTCCGSKSSSGYTYCCTNSDPDGDGWGWENAASCIVPNSAADVDKCGAVVTNLSNQTINSGIALWEDPLEDKLYLELPVGFSNSYHISVFSERGVLVFQEYAMAKDQPVLSTAQLVPGIYLLKITSPKAQAIARFVKTR